MFDFPTAFVTTVQGLTLTFSLLARFPSCLGQPRVWRRDRGSWAIACTDLQFLLH